MSIELYKVKHTYNIVTRVPSILGASYNGMRVKSTSDYEEASKFRDVAVIHKQILSLLPAGTPSNPEELEYVKFRNMHGKDEIFAVDWLDHGATVEVQRLTLEFTVSNVSIEDRDAIVKLLRDRGNVVDSVRQY